jgi:deoxyribose-phosphate aldolase
LLKVNLESEFLTEELNIIACRIARRAGADYIGTNKLEDVPLLLSHARDRLKIKCHGQIGDLEAALALREAGCARIEIAEPISILEAWKARCGAGG